MIHVEVNRVSNDYGFEGIDASGHTRKNGFQSGNWWP